LDAGANMHTLNDHQMSVRSLHTLSHARSVGLLLGSSICLPSAFDQISQESACLRRAKLFDTRVRTRPHAYARARTHTHAPARIRTRPHQHAGIDACKVAETRVGEPATPPRARLDKASSERAHAHASGHSIRRLAMYIFIQRCTVFIQRCTVFIQRCTVFIQRCTVFIQRCSVLVGVVVRAFDEIPIS